MQISLGNVQKIANDCIESFWFFYSQFAYSKDVNDRKNPHKKAPQWRYLKKFMKLIEENRRLCILKTRQMFFSTFAVIYVLWLLLFSQTEQQIFIISESLQKAYNKADDSLYGRIMYAYKHLPDFLKTTITPSFAPQVILRNKVTGVTITFSANAPTAGRGSSYDLVLVDEYAWHEKNTAKDLISSLTPMCYRIWVFSSPRGRNHFWQLINQIKSNEIEGFYFWDATKEQIDPEDTARIEIYNGLIKATPLSLRAREFGGSFDETQEGKTFPDFNFFRACLTPDERVLKSDLFKYPKIGGMDYGIGDNTALVLCLKRDGEYVKALSLEMNNCLPEAFYGACVGALCKDYDLTELEARQVLGESVVYGDSSSMARSPTHDTTLLKEYRHLGMRGLVPASKPSIKDGILAVHKCIDRNGFREYFEAEYANLAVITHIANCHYPISNSGVIMTVDKYDHDSVAFSSHVMDCVRYMIYDDTNKTKLQGFESVVSEADKHNAIAKKIIPVFVGRVKDYNGQTIHGQGRNDSNLT